MTKQEFLVLIDKYLTGTASEEEMDLLSRYYNSFQEHRQWNEAELGPKAGMEQQLLDRIRQQINEAEPARVIPFREQQPEQKAKRFPWRKMAAAAAVIGLLLLGAYAWWHREGQENREAMKVDRPLQKDILPGGDKAVLTLADGSAIVLDQAQNGALSRQGGTSVVKTGGKLAYVPGAPAALEVLYNTLTTPRGGQYQVQLPDGSLVWLNAASSLHFPTAFGGKERRVEITGEAYFEVAKDRSKPFVVAVNGAEVQVLGTHFNVMAYTDEGALKTTLLEGSVRFSGAGQTRLLEPGQQSQLTKTGAVNVVSGVDTESVVAWRKGMFHFDNADIETVMRQLARWYNVEVVFKNRREYDPLHVSIPRSTRLSNALKMLELSGSARFRVDGNRIVVLD
ncbi:FecR domain-containing protein [Paraflavisolibacter sp. H34]|uniref:FecR domain-containing protein n=1 Tax=Huijunlia imazamoxiresistens TaxID=3127457 RepID=UPI00301880A9